MATLTKLSKEKEYDFTKAIEIAPAVWWVGHVLENDIFQCHVYLIENEEESILIDPGSKLTWPHTRRKIQEIMPLENIKYIICHHQDPDITSGIADLLAEIGTQNRYLVTHWRAAELLDHYDWGIEYYEVQAKNWRLSTKDRLLEFVFTPYMHFPGAFCTYDTKSGILFSSDIFGALTESFSLFAKDADSYFRQMEPFHTHYMPASEIVNHGLDNILKCEPINMIAPQHGSIITKEQIGPIIQKLRTLRCGLYLEFGGTRKIGLMTKVNAVLPKVFETAAFFESFHSDTQRILASMRQVFPIERIFSLVLIDDSYFVKLDSNSRKMQPCKQKKSDILEKFHPTFHARTRAFIDSETIQCLPLEAPKTLYTFPLHDMQNRIFGIGMFVLDRSFERSDEMMEMLQKFEIAVDIIAKHEAEAHLIEKEKTLAYAMAITDKLTGLYNRYYLEEAAAKELAKGQRHGHSLSFCYLDIDFFKRINDTYGHDVGDEILQRFAHIVIANLRESDMAFRLGGEEFLVILPYTIKEDAVKMAERLRYSVKENGCLEKDGKRICFSFSGGITDTEESGYELERLLKRADEKLYEAKKSGRDRIVF
ncbi:diguanylate cyclase [Hydrogenimonas urashimensis]|uniref:diguanylate cyclase n=1 Tax=Hydrogenimonas urashimensis TaxID=2740515 RepID=UPI00191653B9|nr:diguanylate cyclase [Hydrogenimonas urashimensis]